MTSAYYEADEAALFEVELPPPVSLADRFVVPPFSVLDRRQGDWQDRKRRWLSLGIQSELGRADHLIRGGAHGCTDFTSQAMQDHGLTSVFDPVLCELAYRWFTPPGARVLDPFAGGSIRGVAASILARWYCGIELRPEQVEANRAQAHLGSDMAPGWLQGDATALGEVLTPDDEFDLLFTCPPYADLEVYSDDPRDLSNQPWPTFLTNYRKAVADSLGYLRNDRFAAWVISDVRDKQGSYRGLVGETVRAFQDAGAELYNDAVVLDPVGTARLRAGNLFERTRKLSRLHQHLLVFVKGNPKRAAAYAKSGSA